MPQEEKQMAGLLLSAFVQRASSRKPAGSTLLGLSFEGLGFEFHVCFEVVGFPSSACTVSASRSCYSSSYWSTLGMPPPENSMRACAWGFPGGSRGEDQSRAYSCSHHQHLYPHASQYHLAIAPPRPVVSILIIILVLHLSLFVS